MTGTEEVINQLGALSYGGIWFVSFLSNVVIPIPEEIVLLALGYLSGTGAVNGFIVIPIIISALLANDIILYSLAKRGSKITTYLYNHFFAKRLEKRGDAWLNMNIGSVIFFSRFLVQLRFIGPFIAGTRRLPIKKFILYDFLALVVYVPLFTGLGWYFHSRIILIIEEVGIVKNIILLIVALVLFYSLARFLYKLTLKNKTLTK
jgi:membrane protein DedA with SNARE-associated domain